MSKEKAAQSAKHLSVAAPLPYAQVVAYIEELERDADSLMVNAAPTKLLRQNQGKVQVLRELLEILNI